MAHSLTGHLWNTEAYGFGDENVAPAIEELTHATEEQAHVETATQTADDHTFVPSHTQQPDFSLSCQDGNSLKN